MGIGVYESAGGPLARAASPLAARARGRRHAQLRALTGWGPRHRVLDVGCGVLGLLGSVPDADVTGVDLVPRPSYPGAFVQADATQGLPFADGAFDLVVASSVVEHIAPADRARFAAEVRRVGQGFLVQTPAWSFPVEPHALLPAAHWMPARLRRSYWRLGAQGHWEDIRLLRRAELRRLFPDAAVWPEAVGPLTKSWLAVRAIG